MKAVSRFLQSDAQNRKLLLEAVYFLGRARLMMRLMSFRRLRDVLADDRAESSRSDDPNRIRNMGKAIERASRHLPWKCACMTQAIAGKMMLRRRGLPGKILIGIDKPEKDSLDSHAWLMCGDVFVTGERDHERFNVMIDFVEQKTP
jgi:hypothetical protein